jgi:hypothetical protein
VSQTLISIVFIGVLIATSAFASETPLPKSPSVSLCRSLFTNAQPIGEKAIHQAPEGLKKKLWNNWKTLFKPSRFDWTLASAEVLTAVNPVEARSFIKNAIRAYVQTAPFRVGKKLPPNLLDTSLDIVGISIPMQLHTPFTRKYGLEEYGQISYQVLSDILPPQYAQQGISSANSANSFSTSGLGKAFQAAIRLGLEEEADFLIMIMLIHEDFEGLWDAAQALNDDELLYKAGLYVLGKFYYDLRNTYYPNTLWDAVELLKRVRGSETRAKVRSLLVDLTDEILSPAFYAKLLTRYHGDETEARSIMGVLVGNLLRGLKASGDILYIRWEDSLKVDIVSTSTDPDLRNAIRRAIAYAETHNHSHDYLIDSLMATNDREELSSRAAGAEASGRNALLYYAALGNVPKTVELFRKEGISRYAALELSDLLFRSGTEAAFLAEVGGSTLVFGITGPAVTLASEFEVAAAGRLQPEFLLKTTDFLNRSFSNFLNFNRAEGLSAQQAFNRAEQLERRGNNLNAGSWYLRAAFAHYLGDPLVVDLTLPE